MDTVVLNKRAKNTKTPKDQTTGFETQYGKRQPDAPYKQAGFGHKLFIVYNLVLMIVRCGFLWICLWDNLV